MTAANGHRCHMCQMYYYFSAILFYLCYLLSVIYVIAYYYVLFIDISPLPVIYELVLSVIYTIVP